MKQIQPGIVNSCAFFSRRAIAYRIVPGASRMHEQQEVVPRRPDEEQRVGDRDRGDDQLRCACPAPRRRYPSRWIAIFRA